MNPTLFDIVIALAMLAISAGLVVWFRGYLAGRSHRRMTRMLISVGLDPAIVARGDNQTIMREVRRRCRRCSSEDLCERWLDEEGQNDNSFCPNAQVFECLKQATDSTVDSGHLAAK